MTLKKNYLTFLLFFIYLYLLIMNSSLITQLSSDIVIKLRYSYSLKKTLVIINKFIRIKYRLYKSIDFLNLMAILFIFFLYY